MTTKEILNIDGADFIGLTPKKLAQYVSSLRSTARKRASRLERKGQSTPALRGLKNGGGLPAIKGMNEQELKREFVRYKSFLESPTSTISGFNKYRDDIIDSLRSRGVDIDNKMFDDFWENYERLKEIDPSIENSRFKYKSLGTLADFMRDGQIDFEDAILKMQEAQVLAYEEEEFADLDGVSGFFE